ncbi:MULTISPECIES: alanine racemase [Thermomonospora]|uniref:Alanine racemase domain protein n=1 Tax=Thermomonospora curvata (strain ATCC 19995 / DSM 43183 / JCM 3096 / KCTC 9072 / NBRC 15933 / NCIMB 10081 / Henssen B9) TaxID=471852 RepID=D1A2I4_THECD|nr:MULTISPECIES: alanine racemase [Thermomonospora]ACY96004.1 alanine racemase domain protein [Thermomonospora curvata DSM 43183]PKK16038.1 MAG: alanine racemase [Thermomonospora sp. CIF 1]
MTDRAGTETEGKATEGGLTGWEAACADRTRQTPFLALHGPRLLANVQDMAARVASRGGRSTPHLKSHKCLEVARAQRAAGATRATVATVAEAEVALAAGFESVLVAYPPLPGEHTRALADLAGRCHVTVTCCRPEHIAALAATGAPFDVYWEVDSGTRRLGTPPGPQTAQAVAAAPFDARVRLRGLMTFAGHAYGATGEAALAAVRDQQDRALEETRRALAERGLAAPVLSVGVTPLARLDTDLADEYRYGNYVFYDATQVALGGPDSSACSLAVISTVVDVPAADRLVLDAGSKSLPAERMTELTLGFGLVAGRPGLVIEKLYEEHGLVRSAGPHGLKPGDRVAVIPNHACTTVNLFSRYVVYDGESFTDTWPIRARRR